MVDNVTDKLKVAPTILGERGKEGVEFGLGEADNMGSVFFSDVTFLGLRRVDFSFFTCLLSLSHHVTNHPSIPSRDQPPIHPIT